VRIAALKALCDIWSARPRLLPAKPAHLDACLLRLRDRKKGVQREAASGLLALFRTLAEAHSRGRLEAKVAVELWGRIPATMLGYMSMDVVSWPLLRASGAAAACHLHCICITWTWFCTLHMCAVAPMNCPLAVARHSCSAAGCCCSNRC
jgi:hypothetical protein